MVRQPVEEVRTVIHARGLSFAKGWILAEASDAMAMPEKKCVALDDGKTCLPIEYGPDFIPKFAANQNVYLSHDTAPEYVRFWFEYVRSGAERFMLVETLDDMLRGAKNQRRRPENRFQNQYTDPHRPLNIRIDYVLFRDTLMDCTLEVSASGAVSFVERNVITESPSN